MKTANRLLALSVLATGALFCNSTFACSTDAWASVAVGSTAGDPNVSIARVAGKCGLKVTASGLVTDNTPDGETTFIARFYFYGKNIGAGTHTIFGAYTGDNASGEVFKINYDGANIIVDATSAGGNSQSVAANPNLWNLVEVSWSSGASGSLWINADATTAPASASFTPGTGSIGSASLGAISAIGADTALFDDYVSHRSLPVGPVLLGDANGNGSINIADVIAIANEYKQLNPLLASGAPDCNLSGGVNIADVICTASKF